MNILTWKKKWLCLSTILTLSALMSSYVGMVASAQQQSEQQIKGKVIDPNGNPIAGVSVYVKGSSVGATTDVKGEFTLRARLNQALVFSFIGYETQELTGTMVNGRIVNMQESVTAIEEVVVDIGYGVVRKVDLLGAVASVGSEVARERVVMNLGDALKGKIAGVVVTASDGTPGEAGSITIRGNTSLSSDSEPLYVIDGVISDASDVIPSQIATIDILKDASSTAIYGSRGANGVILITTVAGKNKTKSKVDVYAMYGVQHISNVLDLMNSEEVVKYKYINGLVNHKTQLDLALGVLGDANAQPTFFVDDEGFLWQIARNAQYSNYYYQRETIPGNTDWQKELYRVAPIQDYRVTVSGGGDNNNYSIIAGFKDQEGLQIGSSYKDFSLRSNFRQNLGKKVTVGLNTSILRTEQIPTMVGNSISVSPLHPTNQERITLPQDDNNPPTWVTNPLMINKLIKRHNKELNHTTTASLKWNILKELVFNMSSSYLTRARTIERFYPNTVNRENANRLGGVASVSGRNSEELRSENTLAWDTKFHKKHAVGLMGGFSISTRDIANSNLGNSNFSLQDLGWWGMSEGLSPQNPEYSHLRKRDLSYFARGTYGYDDRYLFKTTFRIDGSSVFASNNKYGYFPSASAAWRISQEEWMKGIKAISNLKLRVSWGISGKQAIDSYLSMPLTTSSKISYDGIHYAGTMYFSQMGNMDLHWESTRETNLGIDLGVLRDRISITFDVYDKLTYDLLYMDAIPKYTGYSELMKNVGEVQNRGVELSIFASPIRTKEWNWDMNFNIAANRNKIKKLSADASSKLIGTGWGNAADAVQGILKVGQPLGNWYGYKTQGIWQSWAEIQQAVANGSISSTANIYPGYIHIMNQDDDPAITADDRVVLGNGFPKFTGGLSNSLSWRDITVSCTFQFSMGQDIFNATAWAFDGVSPATIVGNQYNHHMVNAWQPTLWYYDVVTGQKGELFQEGSKSNRYPTQSNQRINNTEEVPLDWYIQDGSFLRLADVTLSYDLPRKLANKLGMAKARLFVNGTNLHLWSSYDGYDPEVNNSRGQASYLMPGLDNFAYPKARTYSIGLNITF